MIRSAIFWIQSYLSDRSECVAVAISISKGKCLTFGVPQRSILGPRKYYFYSRPISEMCSRHSLLHHRCRRYIIYLAIHVLLKETWLDVCKKNLQACLADISAWICVNMFMLNQENTELSIFTPKEQVRITEEIQF